MIYRCRLPAPESFLRDGLRTESLRRVLAWKQNNKRGRDLNPHTPLQVEGTLSHLSSVFDDKCPFCETRLGRVELLFFRPRSDVQQRRGLVDCPHHYWWLIWDWDNLYPACPHCLIARGSWFPIAGKRVGLGVGLLSTGGSGVTRFDHYRLRREDSLILDPCDSDEWRDPKNHLRFLKDGTVVERAGSAYGGVTIEAFDLNRDGLVSARKKTIDLLELRWNQTLNNYVAQLPSATARLNWVTSEVPDGAEYAGAQRQLLRDLVADLAIVKSPRWPLQIGRSELIGILKDSFNKEELGVICFDLNIDPEDLEGKTRLDLAVGLLVECESQGLLESLWSIVCRERPKRCK